MRQLTALDAQFLNAESGTTAAHVGSAVLVDPSSCQGEWGLDAVRAVVEQRLHLVPVLRQRLVELPLGLGRPYWAEDPDFDLEFHLRELAVPAPGSREQLGEQLARIHARPLDRSRPLWEAYVITGLEGGRAAFYTKIHHAAIDGVSGEELLESMLDLTPEPRVVPPEATGRDPGRLPSQVDLLLRGAVSLATSPVAVLRAVPRSLGYLDELPGAANIPGVRLLSSTAATLGRLVGGPSHLGGRELHAPRTPFNGPITAHRRFGFGSVPLADVKRVKNHLGMTVNDVVMAMAASALRRWLLDHDALPPGPLVAAVPVSLRTEGHPGSPGNDISVMLAELPTHLASPRERAEATQAAMVEAKQHFEASPPSLYQDLSTVIPSALSGQVARALFRASTVPGVLFNLFVSNIPGPQVPLYLAGARVEGIHPASAVTDWTGGLNITVLSYDGHLDMGVVTCREMVPDVWNLVRYLSEALDELVALVPT